MYPFNWPAVRAPQLAMNWVPVSGGASPEPARVGIWQAEQADP